MSIRFSGSSDQFNFSKHAIDRMSERKIQTKDVLSVLKFGKKIPDSEGCYRYSLPPGSMVAYCMKDLSMLLAGIIVVIDPDNWIVTVYKEN